VAFDVIVVGAGGLGSAVLYHLAKAGATVLALDRFAPPHDRGSSHGGTRIYRQAYYEAPEYVPLAVRALDLWRSLERDSGTSLFANTGGLTIGAEECELVSGALRSARLHGLAHEILTASETARRFPAFRPQEGAVAVFEPTAGVLFPEACVAAHLSLGRALGAAVIAGEAAVRIEQRDTRAAVTTNRSTYRAKRVVVTAGPWAPRLLGADQSFTVTRETVHWFATASAHASATSCPVAMIDGGGGPILYTIPDFGDGFKAALHNAGPVANPESPAADDTTASAARVAALVSDIAPGGAGALRTSAHCYYTKTPDGHFAIGALPSAPAILLASACSGHGFKFTSVLGEAVARLALGENPLLPSELFDPARLF
jgi:sarcosine oxidase